MKKPLYIYLVPKSKFPKNITTVQVNCCNIDIDSKTYKQVGIEVLDWDRIEIDGKEIK